MSWAVIWKIPASQPSPVRMEKPWGEPVSREPSLGTGRVHVPHRVVFMDLAPLPPCLCGWHPLHCSFFVHFSAYFQRASFSLGTFPRVFGFQLIPAQVLLSSVGFSFISRNGV